MPPENPDGGPDDGPDPIVDPATAAAVRQLLQEARHDAPPPPEVTDRLDATLAALRAERMASPVVQPPVTLPPVPQPPVSQPAVAESAPIDLASRRRRRRGAVLLAAAAAVVAVGVGGVVVPRLGGTGNDASVQSESAGQADSARPDDSAGAQESSPEPPMGNNQLPSGAPDDGTTAEDAARIAAAADSLAPYTGEVLDDTGRDLRAVALDSDLAGLLGSVAGAPTPAGPRRCSVDLVAGAVGVSTRLDGETVLVEVLRGAASTEVRVLGCDGSVRATREYDAD